MWMLCCWSFDRSKKNNIECYCTKKEKEKKSTGSKDVRAEAKLAREFHCSSSKNPQS